MNDELKRKLEKQDARAKKMLDTLASEVPPVEPVEVENVTHVVDKSTTFPDIREIRESDYNSGITWLMSPPSVKDSMKFRAALDIAIACLNSPRHFTLNEGFAKQCVDFVDALERECNG